MFLNKTALCKEYNRRKKCNKIFVAGIEHGVGATHFSILLANYRANILKEKVAIVDFNKDSDYIFLGNILENQDVEKGFLIDKVSYYPCVTSDFLEEIFLKDYDCIIIDAGDSYLKYRMEAGLCDIRYLILSTSLWKSTVLQTKYQEYFSKYKNFEWRFLYCFGGSKEAKNIEKLFGKRLYRIPFIENPYRIERNNLDAVKSVIGEV